MDYSVQLVVKHNNKSKNIMQNFTVSYKNYSCNSDRVKLQCMLQLVSTMWNNTLTQQMLLHSAKLDQKSDLPSNASQVNVVFTLHTQA